MTTARTAGHRPGKRRGGVRRGQYRGFLDTWAVDYGRMNAAGDLVAQPFSYAVSLTEMLDVAAALPPGGPLVNADDPAFTAPDSMPARIRDAAHRAGAVLPDQPAAIVRCILDSLAAGYARTIRDAERLADRTVGVVHIVGGGSQNGLLCQLTADATGNPVIAGPVEATALGNVLVQARAAGELSGGLPELRKIVADGTALERYEPAGHGDEPRLSPPAVHQG